MLDRCHDAHTDGSRPARRFPRPSRTRAAMARDGSIEPRETRAVSLAEGQVRHWEWNRARRRSSSGAGSTAGREPQRSDADQDVLRDICAPTVVAPREGRRPAFETVPASSPESAIPSPARGRCAPLTAYKGTKEAERTCARPFSPTLPPTPTATPTFPSFAPFRFFRPPPRPIPFLPFGDSP